MLPAFLTGRDKNFWHKEDASMKAFRNRFQKGVAATLLLTSLGTAAVAQGVVGGFSSGLSGDERRLLQINGNVVCSQCSLEEVRQAQPQERRFYQFAHKNGQLVFKVISTNNPSMFQALAWPPRLWVRASDEVLQKLSAEDNLFKPLGITGVLRTTRTLDVTDVALSG
jgi:hypothetical protein